jgi:hypothetical protein
VAFDPRGVQTITTNELHPRRWDMLRKFGKEVQRVEEVYDFWRWHSQRLK